MPASLLTLYSTGAVALSRKRFEAEVEQIDIVCKLDNFSLEALTWYDMWKNTNQPKNVAYLTLEELVMKHRLFTLLFVMLCSSL